MGRATAAGMGPTVDFCPRVQAGDACGVVLPGPEGAVDHPVPRDPTGESCPGQAVLTLLSPDPAG